MSPCYSRHPPSNGSRPRSPTPDYQPPTKPPPFSSRRRFPLPLPQEGHFFALEMQTYPSFEALQVGGRSGAAGAQQAQRARNGQSLSCWWHT